MKRKAIFLLVGCLAMTGCARYKSAGAPYGAIEVIGHRGAAAYAPENTLASFQKAIEMGADWIELDCTLSRDGEVVVIHDDSVDRTTNGRGYVRDLTLYDIKQLDAGSWMAPEFAAEKVPTLDQVLELAKGKVGVYIEIKNSDDDRRIFNSIVARAEGIKYADQELLDDIVATIAKDDSRNLPLTRKVIELVRKRNMKRQVVVQSFSPIVCAIMAAEAPGIRCEMLVTDDPDGPISWENYLRLGYLFNVSGFNVNVDALTLGRLETLQQSGRTVAVWTVNDLETMKRVTAWGVNGIITDKPDIARGTTDVVNRAGGPEKQ